MLVTISVKQKDLEYNNVGSFVLGGPLARAVNRKLCPPWHACIWYELGISEDGWFKYRVNCPKEVREYSDKVQNEGCREPYKFQIEIPEEYLTEKEKRRHGSVV